MLVIILCVVLIAVGTAWYYLDQHLDDISADMEEQSKQVLDQIDNLKYELTKKDPSRSGATSA